MATRLSAAVRPYVLSESNRHLPSRFSFGIDESRVAEVRRAGSGAKWFEQQLAHHRIADRTADSVHSWYPMLTDSPATAWSRVRSGERSAWEYGLDFANYSVAYSMTTQRQVRAIMHSFWSNLLYIPAHEDRSFAWRFHYDQTLRAQALTSYRSLLRAAVVHPAMSGWLTNYDNTKRAVNENLGRELLELFTVGRDRYSEADVVNASRLLTGYRVKMFDTFEASYSPNDHWTGPVSILSFNHANSSPDGQAAVLELLDYLALHPATAKRIARRLCQRFVSDTPSPPLVSSVASAYLKSGSDIKTTLRALVRHPEFTASRRRRLENPVEDIISTAVALGIRPQKPTNRDASIVQKMIWMMDQAGQRPFSWPRPDGFPEVASEFATAPRMLRSWNLHYALVGNWWGADAMKVPSPEAMLPITWPLTLEQVIEHQHRLLLGRSTSDAAKTAICSILNRPATFVYRSAKELDAWQLVVIRGTIVNLPEGIHR